MKSLLEKPSYQELKAKMTVVRPQDSVVGVMLYWDKACKASQHQMALVLLNTMSYFGG